MTSEELEREIKRLEEQIKDQINSLRIKFLESEENKKPYEVEVPEDIEEYIYLNENGRTGKIYIIHEKWAKEVYQRGLAFKNRKELEQYDKERILLFKLHKWAEEHNEGWTPNWSDVYEKKHFIAFEKEGGIFDVNWSMCYQQFTKLPYFKSVELAWEFVEEFGDEIKEVLC